MFELVPVEHGEPERERRDRARDRTAQQAARRPRAPISMNGRAGPVDAFTAAPPTTASPPAASRPLIT